MCLFSGKRGNLGREMSKEAMLKDLASISEPSIYWATICTYTWGAEQSLSPARVPVGYQVIPVENP